MEVTYLDNKIKKNCNGCGVCALVCPKKCIKMIEDSEGFLYPEINEEECIHCNKCSKLCSNFNDKNIVDEKAYISINKSEKELNHSSSGGIFFVIAKYVIKNNGVVFGVTYNDKLEVVHECSDTIEGCKKFCGSKYVRSDLQNSYIEAKEFLDNGRMVLFTGTACQLSGLKKFLNKNYENLILCEILCHANPSPKVFKLYIKNIEKNRNKHVKTICFRSKENGWKNQTPIIKYTDGTKEEENSYFRAFVSEMINRPSCYNCKFATPRRITDFTIADFWGIEKVNNSIDTKNGVSLFTVNSIKGKKILQLIKNEMILEEVDYNLACSFNHYHNVKEHKNRDKFFSELSCGIINENNIIKYLNKYTKIKLHKRILRKLRSIMKRFEK